MGKIKFILPRKLKRKQERKEKKQKKHQHYLSYVKKNCDKNETNHKQSGLKFGSNSDRMLRLQEFANIKAKKVSGDNENKKKVSGDDEDKKKKKDEDSSNMEEKGLHFSNKSDRMLRLQEFINMEAKKNSRGDEDKKKKDNMEAKKNSKDHEDKKKKDKDLSNVEEKGLTLDVEDSLNFLFYGTKGKNRDKLMKCFEDSEEEAINITAEVQKKKKLEEKILNENLCDKNSKKRKLNDNNEDIYGRICDQDGNLINKDENIIAPAKKKLASLGISLEKEQEKKNMSRQIKGLLNRLTDSNMKGIANQIELQFNKISRNEICEILTTLLFDLIATSIIIPERLIQEQALLIAILSNNVGNEVGAYILTEFVVKWSKVMDEYVPVKLEDEDSKEPENLLIFITEMFNFKVVDSTLIFDLLKRLAENMEHKQVKLILQVLRTAGFTLRKIDPKGLKHLIEFIKERSKFSSGDESYTHLQYLLDVLKEVKNNNFTKIPNYDPKHMEHLKDVMKICVRQGNSPSLSVSLEDLLKSDTIGRWWIVGSAYGLKENNIEQQNISKSCDDTNKVSYSDIFMAKAKSLHFSRPPRINIFYAITDGAADNFEAFENLIALNISPNQKEEIFNVILHCCQVAKLYNPIYAYLSEKLCSFDRKYQGLLRKKLLEKLNTLNEIKSKRMRNLALFTADVFDLKALNVTILKNVSFLDGEPQTINFMKECFSKILLSSTGMSWVKKLFDVCLSPKNEDFKKCIEMFLIKYMNDQDIENGDLSKHSKELLNYMKNSSAL